MKSRYESVPQPEGQSASRPECLLTQPSPVCFYRPRGVVFQLPREGRRACLSVVCSLLLFSLLSFFPCWFPGSCLEAGECAVATPAIREVSQEWLSRNLLVAVRFPPTSRGHWHQELRAPTQEPRILQVSPSVFSTQLGIAVLIYLWGFYVLGLRFLAPPAVTSAIEVLTQTFVALLQWRLKNKVT